MFPLLRLQERTETPDVWWKGSQSGLGLSRLPVWDLACPWSPGLPQCNSQLLRWCDGVVLWPGAFVSKMSWVDTEVLRLACETSPLLLLIESCKRNVTPMAGMINCCPACVVIVLNVGSMFKKDFGYGSETRQTCNDKWGPTLGGFRPVNDRLVAQ